MTTNTKKPPAPVAEKEVPQFDLNTPQYYLNRELSMLEFQRRVLGEAQDATNPILERVKFVAIIGSNLDEFFMVRVGGLKMQIAAGVTKAPPDGLTPAQQLAAIRKAAHKLMGESRVLLQNELMPGLRDEGVNVLDFEELNEKHKANVQKYFDDVLFPVLTPLAFDPGHPFPHISNLSLNLAVVIRDEKGHEHFSRVKVPSSLPRLMPLKRSSGSHRKDGTVPYHHYFVWIEQVIAANLDKLFPGMEIIEAHPFRVTRNADMAIQELEADDLLSTMEKSVRKRRFGSVVRVAVNTAMPAHIRAILKENLLLDPNDIYPLEGPLAMSDLMSVYGDVERHDIRDQPFKSTTPPKLNNITQENNIFAAIRRENILVHHPYDSFSPVVNFLKSAARDPNVLAIKQTLYRVGKNAPIVQALLDARERGKQVAVLVELKARFDEESNIGWAKMLEREGVHVIYGLLGLKTHSKIALVVRKEGNRIRRYIHLATGNYNSVTAKLYEDIGMFTVDEDIGADATDLFNYLTGYSNKRDYRKLLVAPINLRSRIEQLIHREIEHQEAGRKAHLILKTNALVDKKLIKLLYQASQAGVKVDLIVRGICCLRPGVVGLSENIRVISILGRFLEHSRIYYALNDGDEEVFLGSADLMPRNLNRRVEVLFPIEEPQMIRRIRDKILQVYMDDNVRARLMQPDGTYKRLIPNGKPAIDAQAIFLKQRKG